MGIRDIGHETRFSSINQPEKQGRKPSKLAGYLRETELSKADIERMFRNIMEMSEEQIKDIAVDKSTPLVFRSFARAVLKDLGNDNVYVMERILDRFVGKATQKVEQVSEVTVKTNVDLSKLSDKELKTLEKLTDKAAD